jgi:hypothetical protein
VGVGAPGAGFETEARGLLRWMDLQLRLALSRRRVLASTTAEECAIAQSGNVDASWCRCGTAAVDVQKLLISLIR